MNTNKTIEVIEAAFKQEEIDTLLSLQSLEGEADQGLVQMFSSSSCVIGSCLGS